MQFISIPNPILGSPNLMCDYGGSWLAMATLG